jgi:hypothetical protein
MREYYIFWITLHTIRSYDKSHFMVLFIVCLVLILNCVHMCAQQAVARIQVFITFQSSVWDTKSIKTWRKFAVTFVGTLHFL